MSLDFAQCRIIQRTVLFSETALLLISRSGKILEIWAKFRSWQFRKIKKPISPMPGANLLNDLLLVFTNVASVNVKSKVYSCFKSKYCWK